MTDDGGAILRPSRVSHGPLESSDWSASSSRQPRRVGGPFAWLAGGTPSLQLAAVAIGGVLATEVPAGVGQRICTVLLPSLFVLAARPDVRHLRFGRDRSVRAGSKFPRMIRMAAPRVRQPAKPLSWSKLHGFGGAASEAAFLRTFDRLEEIMQEALELEVGEISEQFSLAEMVAHLELTGFLTADDLSQWSRALRVRRQLLLVEDAVSGPSSRAVVGALSQMWELQTRLIDRRRALFEVEQTLRQREDDALRYAQER